MVAGSGGERPRSEPYTGVSEIEWLQERDMRAVSATRRDAVLARLAERQHGVVAHRQLIARGLSRHRVERMVASRRLLVVHRHVYAVGHAQLRPLGRRLAAVLACGEGAVLSGLSAAEHLGLVDDARTVFDVTVAPGCGVARSLEGLVVHRCRLAERDWAWEDGVPVTSVARTFVDVAAWKPRRRVAYAVNQALVRRIYDQWAVDEILRRPGRLRGVAIVRSVLEERHPDAHLTRSALEARALERLMAAGVPPPRVNVWLADAGAEVDLFWEDAGLAVELDGRAYHAHRKHLDRARDVRVRGLGLRVRRYGWGDVTAGPFPEMIRRELSPTG